MLKKPLRPLGNGVYIIIDAGEAYLDEEYDAERGVCLNQDIANADESGAAADAEGTNGGNMATQRNASWQKRLDEEPWSTPKLLTVEAPLDTTENQIRDRCKRLADAELIDVDLDDSWRVELTGLGKRYLKGEMDMAYHRRPRCVRTIHAEIFDRVG